MKIVFFISIFFLVACYPEANRKAERFTAKTLDSGEIVICHNFIEDYGLWKVGDTVFVKGNMITGDPDEQSILVILTKKQ